MHRASIKFTSARISLELKIPPTQQAHFPLTTRHFDARDYLYGGRSGHLRDHVDVSRRAFDLLPLFPLILNEISQPP